MKEIIEKEKCTSYMQTFSGNHIYFNDIDDGSITVEDIAHSLSMTCRYNGHSSQFYSVAQHSMLVAAACSPKARLYGLMHDATEAYLGDMVNPLKDIFPSFVAFENALMIKIAKVLGVHMDDEIVEEVKYYDKAILFDEFAALLNPAPDTTVFVQQGYKPIGCKILSERPLDFKRQFINTYRDLVELKG